MIEIEEKEVWQTTTGSSRSQGLLLKCALCGLNSYFSAGRATSQKYRSQNSESIILAGSANQDPTPCAA